VKPLYDPTSHLSRSTQLQEAIQAKLDSAAVARAKQPRTAAGEQSIRILRNIPRSEVSVQAARLAKIEDARLAAIACAVARIPADGS
jgi:hypothetical protein